VSKSSFGLCGCSRWWHGRRLVFFAFVVAPTAFSPARERTPGGLVVGGTLEILHWIGLIGGIVFCIATAFSGFAPRCLPGSGSPSRWRDRRDAGGHSLLAVPHPACNGARQGPGRRRDRNSRSGEFPRGPTSNDCMFCRSGLKVWCCSAVSVWCWPWRANRRWAETGNQRYDRRPIAAGVRAPGRYLRIARQGQHHTDTAEQHQTFKPLRQKMRRSKSPARTRRIGCFDLASGLDPVLPIAGRMWNCE